MKPLDLPLLHLLVGVADDDRALSAAGCIAGVLGVDAATASSLITDYVACGELHVESARFDLANVLTGDQSPLDCRWRELFVRLVVERGFESRSASLWRRSTGAAGSCDLELVEPSFGVFGYGRVRVVCTLADETSSVTYELGQFSETGVYTDLRVLPDGYVWLGARRLEGDEALRAWCGALSRMLDLVDAVARDETSVAGLVAMQRTLRDRLVACLDGA